MLVRADQGHFKQGQHRAVTRDITVQNHEVALDQKVCWWVGGDEPELTGVMVSADIAALQDSELSAKRRVVRLQRQLLTARTAHAMHQVGVVKQANVLAARAEMDRLLSRDITAGMVGEPPASEEGLRSLASQLQLKMNEMYSVVHNGVATKVSWYRLCAAATATATARCAAARSLCEFTLSLAPHRFKHMDDDESGLISYLEFQGMVREELLLGHKELPEKILKAAWLALDNDGSGRLTVGEFGQFMQLGGHEKRDGVEKAEARRKAIFEANKRAAQKVREEQEALQDAHIIASMSGEAPATDEEVQHLASKLSTKMHELFSTVHNGIPSKVSWFRLFKHMDDDGSGLISFNEFEGMVREELLLGEKELPVKQLKKVWLALDDDGSGRLKVGEFGAFMNLGVRAQRLSSASSARPKSAQSPRRGAQELHDNRNLRANAMHREIIQRKERYEAQGSKLEKELALLWQRKGPPPPLGGYSRPQSAQVFGSQQTPQSSRRPQSARMARQAGAGLDQDDMRKPSVTPQPPKCASRDVR